LRLLNPNASIKPASQLCGKRIATSFPKIAADYFAKLDPSKATAVRELSGSVEAACGLGLADAVVDLVETGTTMRAAGLEEVEVIMKTQACLLSNKSSKHQAIIDLLKTRVEGYLTATRYLMISYNIERTKLPEASKVFTRRNPPLLRTNGFARLCSRCCPRTRIFLSQLIGGAMLAVDYPGKEVAQRVASRNGRLVCRVIAGEQERQR
jgi:ATP phosphoribosyltransferase